MKKRLVLLASVITLISQGIIYPQTFVVTNVDYEANTIELTTYTGHIWEEPGAEDWTEGDVAAAIMYNGGTKRNITDDSVLTLRYTGRANWN